jgi:hypothetical protein
MARRFPEEWDSDRRCCGWRLPQSRWRTDAATKVVWAGEVFGVFTFSTGLGAAIGVGIDALIPIQFFTQAGGALNITLQ